MKTKTSVVLSGLCLLSAGCSTIVLRDASSGLPQLSTQQITNAGLMSVKDNVYIAFVGSCPKSAMAIVPQCSQTLSNTVCRRATDMVTFKSIQDPSNPSPSFGIEFETMPQFNPCTQPNLDNQTPGAKNCTIVTKPNWPGQGQADLIIKYKVTTPSGTCDLDPYLVLRR